MKTIHMSCPPGEKCFHCEERPATQLVIRGATRHDRELLRATPPAWPSEEAEAFVAAFDDYGAAMRLQHCDECCGSVPIYNV